MTSRQTDTVFIKGRNVVFRQIGDESVLVPIADNVGDLSCIYTLNETGTRIWELLDGKRDIREIIGVITDEYDISADAARDDVCEFINELVGINFLEKA
ncbi:MAG: PqqD family protein [Deltaproteobacteria bacterium]|nr:PqqD family protein [Deltaproteobacteria bacterium]